MELILEFFRHLLDPDWIMKNGGLYLVLLILFIETGVFFGFMLPGDPLLFVAGIVIASADAAPFPFSSDVLNLVFWMTLFMLSTILGNFFGYWFGRRFGHIFDRDNDTWLIKRQHIAAAREFYDSKGGLAIAIARFLPVVRTFAPIIAGTVAMERKRFAAYNIIGAVLWVGILTGLGFVLGENKWVEANLEFVIIGLVLVVTAPVVFKAMHRKKTTS